MDIPEYKDEVRKFNVYINAKDKNDVQFGCVRLFWFEDEYSKQITRVHKQTGPIWVGTLIEMI